MENFQRPKTKEELLTTHQPLTEANRRLRDAIKLLPILKRKIKRENPDYPAICTQMDDLLQAISIDTKEVWENEQPTPQTKYNENHRFYWEMMEDEKEWTFRLRYAWLWLTFLNRSDEDTCLLVPTSDDALRLVSPVHNAVLISGDAGTKDHFVELRFQTRPLPYVQAGFDNAGSSRKLFEVLGIE